MSTTWWMYLGVGAFVFLLGLFGAYKSIEAPLSEDRGFALTDRKLFQRARRLSPSAD